MANKEYVQWSEVESFCDQVARKYKDADITGVYGPARGGLIFAVILSHRMNVPLLAAPCSGCIIIDDICDSGETMLHYANNTSGHSKPDYTIATMYYKEGALVKPDFYVSEKSDKWIVFPWECKD